MAHIQNLFCSEEFDVEEVSKPVAPVPHYQTNICVKAIPDPVLTNDPRVVEVMLGQEETRKIDYLATMQPELRPHMRRIVTDWMLEVCEDQEAGTEVFLLAVHYLDTFLSSTTIRKSQFQLAAATCLLLASKFSSVVPISADQLVLYTDYSITTEELVSWELLLLQSLRWQLSVVTSYALASHILPLLHLPQSNTCNTLLLHAATSYSASSLPPSLIAAAAILTAKADPSLLPRVAEITRHSEENIAKVADFLSSLAGLDTPRDAEKNVEEETSRPITPKETHDVSAFLLSC